MSDKENFINQYKKLKELNNGKKPLYREFLTFCKTHNRKLDAIFGKDAYSKLQAECGDDPNKLFMERTLITQILDQYGLLVRNSQGLPVGADWTQAKFKPTIEGITKVHNLNGVIFLLPLLKNIRKIPNGRM